MRVSQVIITFDTIRINPGLTIDQLIKKIYERHGDEDAVRFMLTEDVDTFYVKGLIEDIHAVTEKEGKYYLKQDAKIYSKDKILDFFMHQVVEKYPF